MATELPQHGQKIEFQIEQGIPFARTVTWTDANGDAVDITGYTICFVIYDSRESYTETYLTATTTNGLIDITDASNGVFAINLAPADTANLDFTGAEYDLFATDMAGDKWSLCYGTCTLRRITIADIKIALNSTQSDVKELLAQLNTHLVDDAKSFRTLLLLFGMMGSLLAANLLMAVLEHYKLW